MASVFRQLHHGNGFSTWRLGAVTCDDDGFYVQVLNGDDVVALVSAKDEAQARTYASIVAISPEMYRALAAAASCLERFMLPPEQLATMHSDKAAK